jgi:hypothetical protein
MCSKDPGGVVLLHELACSANYGWEGSASAPGERATHGPHSLNSFKMDTGDWVLCAQEQQKGLAG